MKDSKVKLLSEKKKEIANGISMQDPVLRLTTQLLLCEKRILVATVAYCEQKLQALQPNKE